MNNDRDTIISAIRLTKAAKALLERNEQGLGQSLFSVPIATQNQTSSEIRQQLTVVKRISRSCPGFEHRDFHPEKAPRPVPKCFL
jgi:hypothetical protein